MEVKVFNPKADQIVDGDIFIAEVTSVEGRKVVKLVRDADYFERQDNPEKFEAEAEMESIEESQRDDSFDDMDGEESMAEYPTLEAS